MTNLAKSHDANVIIGRRVGVIGRFGGAVGEVDALAKHIARGGCLRGRYLKAAT